MSIRRHSSDHAELVVAVVVHSAWISSSAADWREGCFCDGVSSGFGLRVILP